MHKLLLILIITITCKAKSEVIIKDSDQIISLHSNQFEIVIDSEEKYEVFREKLPWKLVKGVQFINHKEAKHTLIKFIISNEGIRDRQLFIDTDLQWERVIIYQDGLRLGVTGKTVNKSEKIIDDNFQIVPIQIKSGQTTELVFDVFSNVNFGTKIPLVSPEFLIKKSMPNRMKLAFFYGVLSILFLTNLILFIMTRNKLTLAYCFYVFSIAFFSGKADNFMIYYMLPEFTLILKYEYYLNKLILALGFGFYAWAYLSGSFETQKERKLLLYFILVYTIQYLIELIIGSSYYYHTLILFVWSCFILFLTSKYIRQNNTMFLIAVLFAALGISTSMIQALNWRTFTSHFTIFATDYSFIFDVLLFAIITGQKIRKDSKYKEFLQSQLIKQLDENRELQIQANIDLEKKVKERTSEIEEQKRVIQEQNNQIIASVRYAKNIQNSSLPCQTLINSVLREYFIFYKPKDIVSGDFYWVHELNDDKYLVAAVDCTGHGIPGAFMSMIGLNLLNRVVQDGVIQPNLILSKTHEYVQESLKQKMTNNSDGMDMSVCLIDRKEKIIKYSGAKSALIYVQNGKTEKIKGTRKSIGGAEQEGNISFEEHLLSFKETPIIFYLSSDGYIDQFGGPTNRKFLCRNFIDMIDKYNSLPLAQQKLIFEDKIKKWMSPDYNQIDDIMVIGIKEH